MGRELLRVPAAAAAIERLKPTLGLDIVELLTTASEETLTRTYNSQRAIHASHVAHWLAYKARNPQVKLNGAIGHSMGIAAALVAADALDVEDSGRFIAARAKAFADCCAKFTEPMGLAAASTEQFQDIVDSLVDFPGVSAALWNTVGRGTLGGTAAALEAYAKKAQDEDWPVRCKILKVEGPYHTSAFDAAKAPLREALKNIRVRAPRAPVFMGTSGKAESDPERIKELLVEQTVSCELHLDAVRAAYASGCRNFLEVSFKPQPITWLNEQLLDENGNRKSDFTALSVLTGELAG